MFASQFCFDKDGLPTLNSVCVCVPSKISANPTTTQGKSGSIWQDCMPACMGTRHFYYANSRGGSRITSASGDTGSFQYLSMKNCPTPKTNLKTNLKEKCGWNVNTETLKGWSHESAWQIMSKESNRKHHDSPFSPLVDIHFRSFLL